MPPVLETRAVTLYRAPGDPRKKFYRSQRAALIRAAWLLIKARCPETAAGRYCGRDLYINDCKWHALDARYGHRVVRRLTRLWLYQARKDQA